MSSHDGVTHAEVSLERSSLAFTVFAAISCVLPCAAANHAPHAAAKTSRTVARRSASGHYASAHASHGRYAERVAVVHHEAPPAMDPTRATAIQSALIRAGYLSDEPTGVWDSTSIAAMQKLQDANGWQTKYTPDSRALVKLGLGGASIPSSQPSVPVATETASATSTIQP